MKFAPGGAKEASYRIVLPLPLRGSVITRVSTGSAVPLRSTRGYIRWPLRGRRGISHRVSEFHTACFDITRTAPSNPNTTKLIGNTGGVGTLTLSVMLTVEPKFVVKTR